MIGAEAPILMLLTAYSIILLALFTRWVKWMRNFPRLESVNSGSTDTHKVSIIVPVRNQEETIEDSISSLVAQDYTNKEIIVVEGSSSDRTRSILEIYSKDLKIITEPPFPQDWVGKNWACHIGYRQSSGGVLLFTDGDIIHSRNSLTSAMSAIDRLRADLLSLWPKMVMRSFWEKVILPLIFLSFFVAFEGRNINKDASSKYGAFGPFILISRSCYSAIGGHKSLRDSMGEDYRIAQLAKSKGFRLRVLDGSEFISTRMYSGLKEIWGGFLKNEFEGFDYKVLPVVTSSAALFAVFVLPYLAFSYSLFLMQHNSLWFLSSLPLVVTFLCTSILYKLMGYDWKYSILVFLASLIYLAIRMHSTYLGLTNGKISWKGRKYSARGAK